VSARSRSRPGRGGFCAAAVAVALALAPLGCGLVPGGEGPSSEAAPVTDDVAAGCEPSDGAPDDLRCTGLYTDVAAKVLSPRARAFAPAVAFWSDGADKARWIDLPDGASIDTSSMDEWRFPIGTKVWKELRIDGRRLETRFMQKVRDDRWVQAAYVWSADEASATRATDGAKLDVGGRVYAVPKSSECNDCHKGKKDKLLGFEAISLAEPGATGLTLDALAVERRLTAPPGQTSVTVAGDGAATAGPALAWMHVNCGTSCHTGTSTATAYGTGLRLRIGWDELTSVPPDQWQMVRSTVGVAVKTPKWAGDVRVVPGDPRASLVLRLLGQRGGEQMPPIATSLVDEAGRAAVEAWITALAPASEAAPPATAPEEETPPSP
jgi:hypothetical protein